MGQQLDSVNNKELNTTESSVSVREEEDKCLYPEGEAGSEAVPAGQRDENLRATDEEGKGAGSN